MSKLREWLRRVVASEQDLAAAELLEETLTTGASAISGTKSGDFVRLHGILTSVTLRPKQGLRALEAELFDGSATIELVWLGRRSVAGITPGRALDVSGRAVLHRGRMVMFNPRYSLQAPQESQ